MLGHMRLQVHIGEGGIDACRDEQRGDRLGLLAQTGRFLRNGDSVQIDNHEEEFMVMLKLILKLDVIFDRADIVAKCERTAGLNAGHYLFHNKTLRLINN
ncbi:hypothetical protein D3C73_1326390 [compost metagenome]